MFPQEDLVKTQRPDRELWLEPSGLEKCQKWAYLDAWMRMAKVTMIITIRTPATTPSMVNISGSSSIWRASPSAKRKDKKNAPASRSK